MDAVLNELFFFFSVLLLIKMQGVEDLPHLAHMWTPTQSGLSADCKPEQPALEEAFGRWCLED